MEQPNKYRERLSKLSSADLLLILHECVALLVPVSPSEMSKWDKRTKKQIFNRMESGKYMIFNFDGRKYPIMNDHLKNRQ